MLEALAAGISLCLPFRFRSFQVHRLQNCSEYLVTWCTPSCDAGNNASETFISYTP